MTHSTGKRVFVFAALAVLAAAVPAQSEGWDRWLQVGARYGGAMKFYEYPDADFQNYRVKETAVFAAIQPFEHLGIQGELILSGEKADALYEGLTVRDNNGSTYPASIRIVDEVEEMIVPVLLNFNFVRKNFYFAGLSGVYFSFPQGKLTETATLNYSGGSLSGSGDFDVELPFGILAGINVGYKFGPGVILCDARYAVDAGFVKIDGDDAWRRNMASVSLGYGIGLFKK